MPRALIYRPKRRRASWRRCSRVLRGMRFASSPETPNSLSSTFRGTQPMVSLFSALRPPSPGATFLWLTNPCHHPRSTSSLADRLKNNGRANCSFPSGSREKLWSFFWSWGVRIRVFGGFALIAFRVAPSGWGSGGNWHGKRRTLEGHDRRNAQPADEHTPSPAVLRTAGAGRLSATLCVPVRIPSYLNPPFHHLELPLRLLRLPGGVDEHLKRLR